MNVSHWGLKCLSQNSADIYFWEGNIAHIKLIRWLHMEKKLFNTQKEKNIKNTWYQCPIFLGVGIESLKELCFVGHNFFTIWTLLEFLGDAVLTEATVAWLHLIGGVLFLTLLALPLLGAHWGVPTTDKSNMSVSEEFITQCMKTKI